MLPFRGLIFGILRYDYVTIFANTTSVMLKMHGQYGTKTRGTRLKNGESGKIFSPGKKRKKLKTILLRSSSLNMAGKLQALRK